MNLITLYLYMTALNCKLNCFSGRCQEKLTGQKLKRKSKGFKNFTAPRKIFLGSLFPQNASERVMGDCETKFRFGPIVNQTFTDVCEESDELPSTRIKVVDCSQVSPKTPGVLPIIKKIAVEAAIDSIEHIFRNEICNIEDRLKCLANEDLNELIAKVGTLSEPAKTSIVGLIDTNISELMRKLKIILLSNSKSLINVISNEFAQVQALDKDVNDQLLQSFNYAIASAIAYINATVTDTTLSATIVAQINNVFKPAGYLYLANIRKESADRIFNLSNDTNKAVSDLTIGMSAEILSAIVDFSNQLESSFKSIIDENGLKLTDLVRSTFERFHSHVSKWWNDFNCELMSCINCALNEFLEQEIAERNRLLAESLANVSYCQPEFKIAPAERSVKLCKTVPINSIESDQGCTY
jgi:hypothetical protein